MASSTWFLKILGALFVLLGAIYVFDPSRLAGDVGILFDGVGATDIRATYGGVQIGFGLFLLWASRRAQRMPGALAATAFLMGALAICRALGPLLGDGWAPFHTLALSFEVVVTIVATLLSRRPITPEPAAELETTQGAAP